MAKNEVPSFLSTMLTQSKPCAYLVKGRCGHKEWLLSTGQPWLSCQGVKGLKLGCVMEGA